MKPFTFVLIPGAGGDAWYWHLMAPVLHKARLLVAQSLAGFTAPMVYNEVGAAMLVLVSAMIPKPGETLSEWWRNTRHAEAKQTPFDLEDFFHDVPPAVKDAAFARGEPKQSEAIFRSPCAITAWPPVPTRVWRGATMDVDEMAGGHLVAFSQPAELAARLNAYLSALR